MKSATIKILALVIAVSTLFCVASCSFSDMLGGDETTEATTEPPKSLTVMPEGNADVLAYYNSLMNKVKTVNPKLKYEQNTDAGAFECENETLKAALPTIKNLMLDGKGTSGETAYGDSLLDLFPVKGNTLGSLLTADDISKAECVTDGDTYVINIKLKQELNPEAGASIHGNIFDIPDRAGIIAEFAKAKDYIKVDSYNATYLGAGDDNSDITCVVNRLTDEIIRVEFYKRIEVVTTVVGVGTLEELGMVPLSFVVNGTDKYELDWIDPATVTTAAE